MSNVTDCLKLMHLWSIGKFLGASEVAAVQLVVAAYVELSELHFDAEDQCVGLLEKLVHAQTENERLKSLIVAMTSGGKMSALDISHDVLAERAKAT